jgi:hypothetical protein
MDEKTQGRISIEKLVSLFLKLKTKRPRPVETDYSRWDQTEEQYQQEQAQWLENIRRKKGKDKH